MGEVITRPSEPAEEKGEEKQAEEFTAADQEKLRVYRSHLIEGLPSEKRQDYLGLVAKEENALYKPLSISEGRDYYELTKKQTRQVGTKDWTGQDATKLLEYQQRVDNCLKKGIEPFEK